MAVIDRGEILYGKTPIEREDILHGIQNKNHTRFEILRGYQTKQIDRDDILGGKTYFASGEILDTKPLIENYEILYAEDPTESFVIYNFNEDEIEDFKIYAGQLTNEITINFAYDFVENKPKAAITKRNPLSQILYGQVKKTLDLMMIQHTRQAEKIADAILFTSSIPPIICDLNHNLRSLYLEVGDIVSLTHRAGLAENGYQKALGLISKKSINDIQIQYTVNMKPTGNLYRSELVTLTQTAEAGKAGITVEYEAGVATITIYADIEGYPPVEGAEVTISGVKKITDARGQVRFSLDPGTYTAYIHASGYDDAEITFTV